MLPVNAPGIPGELKALPQWVCWRWEERGDGWTKPPFQPSGVYAASTDSATWSTFEEAVAAYQRGGYDGVGLMLGELGDETALGGIDLDKVLQGDVLAPWAVEILAHLNTYAEKSPSTTGVKAFFTYTTGTWPGERRRTPVRVRDDGVEEGAEFYPHSRYFTTTGWHWPSSPRNVQHADGDALAKVYHLLFGDADQVAHEPPPVVPVNLNDVELLSRVFASRNGEGIRALYEHGDLSAYGDDHSRADLSLAGHLLWWCGGDTGRADRLFRQSALFREKWDRRHRGDGAAYGQMTLEAAERGLKDVYDPDRTYSDSGRVLSTQAGAGNLSQSLPFRTAPELSALTPERPDWIVDGLLARGSISELNAKVKVGKTTLILAMIAAQLRGESFLGLATQRTPVLYLTEERAPSFRAVLERVGLASEERLHILSRTDVGDMSWPVVASLAVQYAREVGATMLVVDTLGRWAGLKDDSENNAGSAMEAMAPLETAGAQGMAVFISRHDRKSGGELGDSGRGSSAFSGVSDIVLSLRRADTEGHPSRRLLQGVGRFEGVPEKLVVEWRDRQYVALGDSVDVERKEVREKLLNVLPGPDTRPGPMQGALVEMTGCKRSTLRRALEELEKEGHIRKNPGAGKTGRGFGYTLAGQGKSESTYGKDPGMFPFPHVPSVDVPTADSRVRPPRHKPLESSVSSPQSLGGHTLYPGEEEEEWTG
ncbi:hypothetical protein FIM08_02900 [SAR202 cluster bacterium AC-647-N09_OGT_505m]|nr:hypothetical protein [SAR202 cluster bacterium AC-647-N09_OGT_505m]